MNFVTISLSDHQMDRKGQFDLPINARPQKCHYCTFPDLDHVPQVYLIGKGITRPGELNMADVGNFFARDRARKVLEVVCPGQCKFHPTFDAKSKNQTPWWLVVPVTKVAVGSVKPTIPRCPECGEPKVAHWGSQYDWSGREEQLPDSIEADIFKSSGWISAEATGEESRWYWMNILKLKQPPKVPPHQWTRLRLDRWLYFSVRIDQLFKTLGIKGVVRLISEEARPTVDDLAWVDQQIGRLAELGLSKPAPATDLAKLSRWFRDYIKKHVRKRECPPDFSLVEALIGKPLPASYKTFLSEVGPMTFHEIDETEGFDATLLGPDDLDLTSYRRGAMQIEGEENAPIDGLLFANTGHGDAFCFNLAEGGPEYPVYLYEHELNGFQPYATNFEACVKRFAGES